MEKQSGVAEVNGTELYYETAGSGETLVLVHAHTCDLRMWDRQFETFARNYNVVRYDVRGYGKSKSPSAKVHSPTLDLKALLGYLNIDHACLIGLSMGGLISIDFALAYPDLTDALIVSDSLLGGYKWKEVGRDIANVYRIAAKHGLQMARDQWLQIDLFVPAMQNAEVAFELQQMVSSYSGWHWLNRTPVVGEEPLAINILETVAVPTLIIVGERDLPDFQIIADILERRVPNSRKLDIVGAGHMANMEASSDFNSAVLGFLTEMEI